MFTVLITAMWLLINVSPDSGELIFDDGSYMYWGPRTTYTGYQYTWKLNP